MSTYARHLSPIGSISREILVGPGIEGELITVQQDILESASPVFKQMFSDDVARIRPPGPIEVRDIEPKVFKQILEFIYTGRSHRLPIDQSIELYRAAHQFSIIQLADNISYCLVASEENACQLLELATAYKDSSLQSKSLKIVQWYANVVLQHDVVFDFSEITLLEIVKQANLNISELDLFNVVKRWAHKRCDREDKEHSGPNLRQMVINILPHIRFMAMTGEEFTSAAKSGILNQEEICGIAMNLLCPARWLIPANITSSRVERWMEDKNKLNELRKHKLIKQY